MNAILGSVSDALRWRDPRQRRYFMIGASAFLVLLFTYALGFKLRASLPPGARFTFSVATGLTLLGCILYQWMLFFARLTRRSEAMRRHYAAHRYVGAAAIVLFVGHAGGFGYAFVTVLALAFVVVAASGLFNKEVLILRRPWLRNVWDAAHIGLAGVLLPLIALHVWAALAFK